MGGDLHEDANGQDVRIALVRQYPEELRRRAVAAVEERRRGNPRDRKIYREIAQQFSVGEQSLRLWVKKRDAERLVPNVGDAGEGDRNRPQGGSVLTAEELQVELDSMRRKIEQLQAENEVLKRAFVVFSAEWSK